MTDLLEIFPPDEDELADIIDNLQRQMNEAESQLEYDELNDKLTFRLEQLNRLKQEPNNL